MARKRHPDEDALKLLREIDVHLNDDPDAACRLANDSSTALRRQLSKILG
jgi:hypothetical protein